MSSFRQMLRLTRLARKFMSAVMATNEIRWNFANAVLFVRTTAPMDSAYRLRNVHVIRSLSRISRVNVLRLARRVDHVNMEIVMEMESASVRMDMKLQIMKNNFAFWNVKKDSRTSKESASQFAPSKISIILTLLKFFIIKLHPQRLHWRRMRRTKCVQVQRRYETRHHRHSMHRIVWKAMLERRL